MGAISKPTESDRFVFYQEQGLMKKERRKSSISNRDAGGITTSLQQESLDKTLPNQKGSSLLDETNGNQTNNGVNKEEQQQQDTAGYGATQGFNYEAMKN